MEIATICTEICLNEHVLFHSQRFNARKKKFNHRKARKLGREKVHSLRAFFDYEKAGRESQAKDTAAVRKQHPDDKKAAAPGSYSTTAVIQGCLPTREKTPGLCKRFSDSMAGHQCQASRRHQQP